MILLLVSKEKIYTLKSEACIGLQSKKTPEMRFTIEAIKKPSLRRVLL
jgi:hypothetical protein